jgi:hypothetical protein
MDDTKINYDDKEQVAHYESKEPLEDQVFETKYASELLCKVEDECRLLIPIDLSRKQILLSKVFILPLGTLPIADSHRCFGDVC